MPEVAADVTLTARAGAPVAVELVRVEAGDGAVLCELLADRLAWARIDAAELLHLDVEARGPALVAGAVGEPVRIEAVLDAIVARDLPADASAAAIAERLRGGDRDDPLRDERSWWALSATREIAPAAGVEGELRAGLRTIWRADPPPAGMATVIAAALESAGIAPSVEPTDDGDWIVRFHDAGAIGLAVAREGRGHAIVYLIAPQICPPERRAEVARLAAIANLDLPIGCLELDLDHGTTRVRASADVTGDRLTIAGARNLVAAAHHLATAWLPTVELVIDGASAALAAQSVP